MTFELPYPAAEPIEQTPALAERLRAGDPAALGDAYDAHHAHVRAFAQRLVGDETIAEDIVQDTFIALPRAIRGYRGGAALRTFLIGVAVNHARHHVRAAARRRATAHKFASEPANDSASPESDAARVELARALNHALDALPLDQRVVFVLCEVEERTSVEAAVVLDVPEATVRTRLWTAKKKLRATLERRGMR